jgi:hypothetical protein
LGGRLICQLSYYIRCEKIKRKKKKTKKKQVSFHVIMYRVGREFEREIKKEKRLPNFGREGGGEKKNNIKEIKL